MINKTFLSVANKELNFPLWITSRPMQENTTWHKHDFVELVVITTGQGIHCSRFEKIQLKTGMVVVIPKGGEHSYMQTENLTTWNILFDPKTLPMPKLDLYHLAGYHALFMLQKEFFSKKNPYPSFQLSENTFKIVQQLLELMQNEKTNENTGHNFIFLGLFMALLGNLARDYPKVMNRKHNESTSLLLGNIIGYLNSNYSQKISLNNIIKMAAMSQTTLYRNFLSATGYTPIDYLLNVRLSHACKLLLETTLPISDIAYQTGFNDVNYFIRIFKKNIGSTPLQYRPKN